MRFVTGITLVLLALSLATTALAQDKKLYVEPVFGTSRALDCANAIPIQCPITVSGDNTGLASTADLYSCVGWNESGGEVVYVVTLAGPNNWILSISGVFSGCDLDLFVLGSCDENDCIFYADSASSMEVPPGTYYIVVDGYNGAGCPFDLTVDCLEVTPPCCPFQYTCYSVDFNEVDAFTVMPCGGAPVWEWGPQTNPEVPAVACDDVPITSILGTTIAADYVVNAGEIAMVGPFFVEPCCYCLELCHWYDIETSYDGGNVKVSTDGGATWQLITPGGGYPGTTNSWPMCIPYEPAFTGHGLTYSGFVRDCFDLTDFVGMEIMVGFFFGSDGSVTYPGWYIKWMKLGSDVPTSIEEGTWGGVKAMYR